MCPPGCRSHEPSRRGAAEDSPPHRLRAVKIAVLGPGGVGGSIAGLLERAGTPVIVVAREQTAAAISARGLRIDSVGFGEFVVRPRAVSRLDLAR